MAESLDQIMVVDADGHVNEGDVDLSSRLPQQWRALAPVRLRDNQGYRRILLEGRIWPTAEGPGPGVTGPFTEKAQKARPGMTDPAERLKDMDQEGIDVAVLFGTQIALERFDVSRSEAERAYETLLGLLTKDGRLSFKVARGYLDVLRRERPVPPDLDPQKFLDFSMLPPR